MPAAPRLGCLLPVLAFPCLAGGLLALPLCGAALTFFAAAPPCQACRCAPPSLTTERSGTRPSLAPLTYVTKDSFIPRAYFVRRAQVHQATVCACQLRNSTTNAHCKFLSYRPVGSQCGTTQAVRRNRWLAVAVAIMVMPDGGARSATLERMGALSLRGVEREGGSRVEPFPVHSRDAHL